METKDYISLGLSSAALITTIVWNIANRRHTDNVARQTRSDSFHLDEWKAKRSEIMKALREVEAGFARLHALTKGAHAPRELKEEISKEGRDLTIAHQALIRELERVDPAWGDLAYGNIDADGERDWDRVHTAIDGARQARSADLGRVALATLTQHAQSLRSGVEEELAIKTAEHNPIKL
ncbi:MAG: hypothetical protein PGN12_07320 [Sphingomonas phyllosphaerae]